jgi:phospholipid-transporting ATPase
VGISGKEGRQAVMAADYAIAQFRFLVPLLLVHGQWSYRRMCKLVLYSFWKNMLFAITNICFGFYSAFSAQVPFSLHFSSLVTIIVIVIAIVCLIGFLFFFLSHRRCTTAGWCHSTTSCSRACPSSSLPPSIR